MAQNYVTSSALEVRAGLADGLDPYGNHGTIALTAGQAQRSDVQATA
jgi:hypothetical protein